MRLTLLPAYCYDDDEDKKEVAEYLAFYRRQGERSLAATGAYIDALADFRLAPDSDAAFNKLLSARRSFIGSFPFCFDELVEVPAHDRESVLKSVKRIYTENVEGEFLSQVLM